MRSKAENDFQVSGLADWARRLREKESMGGSAHVLHEPRTETGRVGSKGGSRGGEILPESR